MPQLLVHVEDLRHLGLVRAGGQRADPGGDERSPVGAVRLDDRAPSRADRPQREPAALLQLQLLELERGSDDLLQAPDQRPITASAASTMPSTRSGQCSSR